jgi:DNA-directed RNA polymerase specialized sigma24 family protein
VFPDTRRSVLERVRSDDVESRRAAFGDLTAGYWRPSYTYLRLHWHLAAEDAEDVVQSFFAAAFEKQYLEKYDPAQARFRTFLRVCLDRFVQNTQKADRAAKRGGGATLLSLDFPGAERDLASMPTVAGDAERFFHDETVRALFGRAVDALRKQCAADGRDAVFAVFARHDLQPTSDTSYATIARDLSLTVSQVTNHLHTARRLFRETALAELRAISATDAEYRDDARSLFGADVEP